MVSVKHVKLLIPIALFASLTGCFASAGKKDAEVAPGKEPVDIYAQLKSNSVQYSNTGAEVADNSPEKIKENIQNARAAYFQKNYVEAEKFCKRVLRAAPTNAEAYYWMARVGVDENDFQKAYDMASQGIPLAKEPGMKRELENIKKMTQMGAK